MLISLTGHFLFYTLFNALAGVSSSVMQTPDNSLKYQRLLGVLLIRRALCLPCEGCAAGRTVRGSRSGARGARTRSAPPVRPSACGWEGASVEKPSSEISAAVPLFLHLQNFVFSARDVNCSL